MTMTSNTFVRTGLAAMTLGATLLAQPVVGAAADVKPVAMKTTQMRGDDVEARIKTLHSQLRVTAEQESAWTTVADAMRENAKARADLHGEQATVEKTATAPEMITAYAKTMDAHAEGVHKFATVFQPLYDSMSDAQKKTADEVFRVRVHQAAAKHAPGKGSK
jgi:hypothetical protein